MTPEAGLREVQLVAAPRVDHVCLAYRVVSTLEGRGIGDPPTVRAPGEVAELARVVGELYEPFRL